MCFHTLLGVQAPVCHITASHMGWLEMFQFCFVWSTYGRVHPNTQAADLLSGTWKLAYTANSELISLLALSRLPLTRVGDITQVIDATTQTFQNKVAIQEWDLHYACCLWHAST